MGTNQGAAAPVQEFKGVRLSPGDPLTRDELMMWLVTPMGGRIVLNDRIIAPLSKTPASRIRSWRELLLDDGTVFLDLLALEFVGDVPGQVIVHILQLAPGQITVKDLLRLSDAYQAIAGHVRASRYLQDAMDKGRLSIHGYIVANTNPEYEPSAFSLMCMLMQAKRMQLLTVELTPMDGLTVHRYTRGEISAERVKDLSGIAMEGMRISRDLRHRGAEEDQGTHGTGGQPGLDDGEPGPPAP